MGVLLQFHWTALSFSGSEVRQLCAGGTEKTGQTGHVKALLSRDAGDDPLAGSMGGSIHPFPHTWPITFSPQTI